MNGSAEQQVITESAARARRIAERYAGPFVARRPTDEEFDYIDCEWLVVDSGNAYAAECYTEDVARLLCDALNGAVGR